jgi:hypothetical protein
LKGYGWGKKNNTAHYVRLLIAENNGGVLSITCVAIYLSRER